MHNWGKLFSSGEQRAMCITLSKYITATLCFANDPVAFSVYKTLDTVAARDLSFIAVS